MLLYLINFFRTVLVIGIIYLLIRYLRKLFNAFMSGANEQPKQQPSHKEGETTIKFNNKGEKIVDKNKGEYVDFEEVD